MPYTREEAQQGFSEWLRDGSTVGGPLTREELGKLTHGTFCGTLAEAYELQEGSFTWIGDLLACYLWLRVVDGDGELIDSSDYGDSITELYLDDLEREQFETDAQKALLIEDSQGFVTAEIVHTTETV